MAQRAYNESFGSKGVNAHLMMSDGTRFDVVLTSVSYGWQTAMNGSAQARRRQVNYPKRVNQTDVTATIRFRSVEEYVEFGRFADVYHERAVSVDDGNSFKMQFWSEDVGGSDYRVTPGINYLVALTSVEMSFKYDMEPAPELTLKMAILRDETGDSVGDESQMEGEESDLVPDDQNLVTPTDVSQSGDGAFVE